MSRPRLKREVPTQNLLFQAGKIENLLVLKTNWEAVSTLGKLGLGL
jgi:hypothetical protein